MRVNNKKRLLGPAFSSYHGRVHIPNITTKPAVFPNKKIHINSVCADHITVDRSIDYGNKNS